MARALGVLTAALAAGVLLPDAAAADLYRCQRGDGSAVYTDNPGSCPNAQTHTPSGALQRVESAPSSRPAGRAPGPDRAVLEQHAAADTARAWRQKKLRKEEELRAVDQQRQDLQEYVTWCNRGGDLVQRDASGLKRKVSCDSVRDELESLEAQRSELQAYLEEGLEEECRRAGCLPGWIR